MAQSPIRRQWFRVATFWSCWASLRTSMHAVRTVVGEVMMLLHLSSAAINMLNVSTTGMRQVCLYMLFLSRSTFITSALSPTGWSDLMQIFLLFCRWYSCPSLHQVASTQQHRKAARIQTTSIWWPTSSRTIACPSLCGWCVATCPGCLATLLVSVTPRAWVSLSVNWSRFYISDQLNHVESNVVDGKYIDPNN